METFCSSDIGLNVIDVCIERICRNAFLLLLNPRIVSIWRVSQPSDSVYELRESTYNILTLVLADCHFAVALYAEVCHSMLTQGTIKNYMLIKDDISQDEVNRLYLLCHYKERI
jgi:hypothetical protein